MSIGDLAAWQESADRHYGAFRLPMALTRMAWAFFRASGKSLMEH